MKEIKVQEVKTLMGGPLPVPHFDAMGEMKMESIPGPGGHPTLDKEGNPLKRPVEKPGDILDILTCLVMIFPRNKLTMKHITECTALMENIRACRAEESEYLKIEDEPWKWLVATLKDQDIGIPIYGMNLASVLAALGDKLT